MSDYLSVEYTQDKRPLTTYPEKLAHYLFKEFGLSAGQSILEVGSGRCELLEQFAHLGLITHAIDSAPSAENFAIKAGAKFELYEYSPAKNSNPFLGMKFDVVFSKSFIEHISEPIGYFQWCRTILKDGGKLISLTPDWEANFKVFYDDVTHVKPFTEISLKQTLEFTNFQDIRVFRFRQLPSTWKSNLMLLLSRITGTVSHHRAKSKWFRWSRELMIASVATYSDGKD
jgi:SAM-dependent methyltransferase